ncbi:MAG TPA: hypothetical protein VGA26_01420, partial [Candidatus Limnocylindria bacterium]
VERVREYGFLAGVAVVAVIVGGAALVLANPAHQTPQPMPDVGEMGFVLEIDQLAGSGLASDPRE